MTNPVNRELSAFDEFIAAWLGPAAQRYVCDYHRDHRPAAQRGMAAIRAAMGWPSTPPPAHSPENPGEAE